MYIRMLARGRYGTKSKCYLLRLEAIMDGSASHRAKSRLR